MVHLQSLSCETQSINRRHFKTDELSFPDMPSLKIQKQCSLTAQDAFKRVSDLLSNDKDLKKLDPKYKAEFDQQTLSGTADGSMFKAKLNVKEVGSGSTLELVIELPFHLALMKGMVEKTLQKKLDETLA